MHTLKNKYMKTIKNLVLVLFVATLFTACSEDDPEVVNEEELITTLTATLTPSGGGTDIILKDISKITSLKIETVKSILKDIDLKKAISEDELVASKFFEKDNYRKIKKKLIYDIAFARIKEICEIIIFQNINFKYSNKIPINIYLNKTNTLKNLKCLEEIFDLVLSTNDTHNVISLDQIPSEKVLISAYKLAHFGWKKEAIPFSKTKKSIIARFFDMIFG